MIGPASIRAGRRCPAPHAACARSALAMPRTRGAPSLRTVALQRPAAVTGASTLLHTTALCCVAAGFSDARAGGLQPSADGDLAGLQVAPQRDGQTSRQGHDADAAHPLPRAGEAPIEPLRQRAAGLQARPAPSQLDQQGAHSAVACFADALLNLVAAEVILTHSSK